MATLTDCTSLAEALETDERIYDRFVAAGSAFQRLAKVVMREDTAGRLTLADIARMGGVPLASVLPDAESVSERTLSRQSRPTPVAAVFDARPMLAAGFEPLPSILDFVEELAPGSSFAVEASFEPKPLVRLFEGRGYSANSQALAADHWRVEFQPAIEETDACLPLGAPSAQP
ncbi:DUF2249 domain-containing protein [Salinarimonas ramus]|uniref:DUF2249 domain-containing protein n=1 Tax=Salinarimonas ramus TaxID=690164 RepID=A0A917QHK1_9HYPH|nr:DUF2249 domain-containing protein [Salinarimonas ramus]GGK51106.1 hypothetical protein GCM10011322_42740 [Salinarimonas ramus]